MPSEISSEKSKRIPTPLYAAAGAGDLAYQQLRKLPTKAAELRERVDDLRGRVGVDLRDRVGELRGKASELRGKAAELRPAVSEQQLRADFDRLRDVARRNATAFANGAHAAQERAAAVYTDLVARGERVVRTVRTDAEVGQVEAQATLAVDAAPADVEPATAETVEAPAVDAPVTEAPAAEDKPAAEAKAARPAAKRARPAAK